MDVEKVRVLLAMSDAAQAAQLAQELRPCQMTTVCRDAQEVVREIKRRPYDVLIAPFAVRGADVSWLMEKICTLKEISFPAVLVLLPEGLAQYENTLYNEGAACVMRAPCGEECLRKAIARLTPAERLLPEWAQASRVSALLDRLCISRRLKGFGCLVSAAQLIARDGALIHRLKPDVYPLCERGGAGNGAVVERAIRHAIETAWLKGDLETQYRLFGNTIDESKGKPTNAEFLSRVVETLRMEA